MRPGILAKIAGLFTARGYNIDSLTVADITRGPRGQPHHHRHHGPPPVIDQIIAQLERLVPVHKVTDLTDAGPHVERELALVKVAGTGRSPRSRRCAWPMSTARGWSTRPPTASCSS